MHVFTDDTTCRTKCIVTINGFIYNYYYFRLTQFTFTLGDYSYMDRMCYHERVMPVDMFINCSPWSQGKV